MRETRILQFSHEMPGDPGGEDPLADNKDAFLAVLEEAERFDPDFVCGAELLLASDTNRHDRPLSEVALEFPGPFTDRVGERAAALDSYVWVTGYEQDGDDVYNSMALVGPDGEYLGTYRKVAPTTGELADKGVKAGSDLPVWDTEFGRVCGTICWDVKFDEIALGYRAKGVDLMFHPTHGLSQGKLAHWATYHGFHVAYCWPPDAQVFTQHGNVVGRHRPHPTLPTVEVDGRGTRFSPATVNTDMKSYGMGAFDYGDSEMSAAQEEYGDSLEVHSMYEDGIMVAESTAEDVSIAEIEAEFDLPTMENEERRTRRLAAESADDSPLDDPDRWSGADERSVTADDD